jgi:hypothetical protein
MKNLAILFCSFRPEQYPQDVNNLREEEYLTCLKQLYRVVPENYEMIIVDNTVENQNFLSNNNLALFLNNKKTLFLNKNIGTKNKGMGELEMLSFVLSSIDYNQYKNISYITARRMYTCPYFFERTENLSKKALISNPDFIYLDGKVEITDKYKNYNDMAFSMTSSVMKEYADYSIEKIPYLITNNLGSEQNLYNFIHEKNIEYEWLNWIGLVRVDWMTNFNRTDIKNVQIN